MITELNSNQVFVFGSNINGYHDGGAAKQAMEWGAIYGVGIGRQGKTYAIPTLDTDMSKLPLSTIQCYLRGLLEHAFNHPRTEFLLTKIGCGIASFEVSEIAPLCNNMPSNVILPKEFIEYNNRV